MRVSVDEYYLNIALAVAKRSSCLKKQYGAVIVNDGMIISTGYNGNPRGETHCATCTKCGHGKDISTYLDCNSVHAEMNAIIGPARRDMVGGTLYLAGWCVDTGKENMEVEPCEICLRLIKNAGIEKVITNKGVIYRRNMEGLLIKQGEK